jgi:excisionase family DNA binding protein
MSVGTMGKLLTSEQVADKLGKPVSWVYNNLVKEKIPFIKLGNQYRFVEEKIDEWIMNKLVGE